MAMGWINTHGAIEGHTCDFEIVPGVDEIELCVRQVELGLGAQNMRRFMRTYFSRAVGFF